MKLSQSILDDLPELPVELLERSAKLVFSRTALVITNVPEEMVAEPPTTAVPHDENKSSYLIKKWAGWALYPRVVCMPFPDLPVAEMKLKSSTLPRDPAADLGAVAGVARYFRLTKFPGHILETGWGCEVRYGPWFVEIKETESCTDLPNQWEMRCWDPAIFQSWYGTWQDRPAMSGLTVIADLNGPALVSGPFCCPGFKSCPGEFGCVPSTFNCPGGEIT